MIVNAFCYVFCMVISSVVSQQSLAPINSLPVNIPPAFIHYPQRFRGITRRSETNQEIVTRNSDQLIGESLNITHLLLNRFYYLFKEQSAAADSNAPEVDIAAQTPVITQDDLVRLVLRLKNESFSQSTDQQSVLETRRIEQQQAEGDASNKNYFKVLNRVFSRIELPQLYKSALFKGGHCGLHIGCVEEIPNFPSLLKKANVSSSFTVYTPDNSKQGHKILYEPIVHHQLQDAATLESELEEKLRSHLQWTYPPSSNNNKPTGPNGNNQKRQQVLIPSWRSAVRISNTEEYPFDLSSLEQSGFNASLNTRIIVGGYFAKEDEEWIDEVVRQWQLLEPCNIIKVSWADSNRGLYHSAAYNSRIVGRQLTLFLHYLDQMFHLDLNRFHLVGHSLGAHIAGFVGADNDGRIARITGLDPAGPIFIELNPSMRLDPTDAKFVDVVHTNGGTITKGALGLSIPSGHVDYYCNGGSVQPGCYFSSVTRSIMDPVERVACSHRRSYRYFIEIIKLTISESSGASSDVLIETRQDFDLNSNNLRISLGNNNTEAEYQVKTAQPTKSQLPRAFLFEAKQDDLDKLTQPEIVMMSGNNVKRAAFTENAPLKRRLEFHLLNPEFPVGKRGLYYFKTRSESPFFATKQYALTIKTDAVIKRKIALMAKIDQTLVAEAELDEIPGVLTLPFAPNDPRVLNISDTSRVPQLSLMWKHRSFNLLMNQQNELHLSGLELSLLDSDDGHQVIRYSTIQSRGLSAVASSASLLKSVFSGGDLALARNQWYKFEGRLDRSNQRSN